MLRRSFRMMCTHSQSHCILYTLDHWYCNGINFPPEAPNNAYFVCEKHTHTHWTFGLCKLAATPRHTTRKTKMTE